MKTSYAQVVEETVPHMKFVECVEHCRTVRQLKPNEYFAIMVIAANSMNRHVVGSGHNTCTGKLDWLIGLDKPSHMGPYISKNFRSRYSEERGQTIIVEIKPDRISDFYLL